MKRIVISTALLFTLPLFTNGQTTTTARVIESTIYSRIIIVHGNGETETIPLENFNVTGSPSRNDDPMIKNQKTINKLIDDMKSSGFGIVSVSGTNINVFSERVIFFEKK